MKLFYRSSISPIFVSAALCISLMSGCAAPSITSSTLSPPAAPSLGISSQSTGSGSQGADAQDESSVSGTSAIPAELSSQQRELFADYVYDWYSFCSDPVAAPNEIPQNTKMLAFACQETWRQKLVNGEELEHVGDPDWQVITLPAEEVEHMALHMFDSSIDFASLPKTPLPCSVEELDTQIKSLKFGLEVYYIPEEDAFLVPSVYGLDLTAIEPAEVHIDGDVITGIIRGENLELKYNFKLDKDMYPFLTLVSIQ